MERISRVLRYIYDHLDAPLRLDELAKIACFSPYHFHRIFQAHIGETLHGYVRRVRLERAAFELSRSDLSVTEAALDAGYETPSAFHKAFCRHFGESPTSYRRKNRAIILPPVTPNLNMEEIMIEPKLVERNETRVLAVRRTGDYNQSAGDAWRAIGAFAGARGLFHQPGIQCIGVSYDDPDTVEAENLRYDACITVSDNIQPEGEVKARTLAGGRYAMFLHEGPYENLVHTYRGIFGQWLPASGEELREEPCFEIYLNSPDQTPPQDLKTEIYVPIR